MKKTDVEELVFIFFLFEFVLCTMVIMCEIKIIIIAKVGQWVTNKIFSVHFLIVSVSFEKEKNSI